MHKVHRPHLVNTLWQGQRLRFVANQALSRLDSQIELQPFVDSIHTLVIPFELPDVAQIQVTQAKAPAAVAVRQPKQPVDHFSILNIEFSFVAIARLTDAKYLARHPDARTALAHRSFGYLPSVRWSHHFFSRASATISALSFSSR